MLDRLKNWASIIKRDAAVLWLAARDDRVPWVAKVLAGLVAIYVFSPIDLIPDFIPVIGYLDDLLIVPLGIILVVKLIPTDVLDDLRKRAVSQDAASKNSLGILLVVTIWVLLGAAVVWNLWDGQ